VQEAQEEECTGPLPGVSGGDSSSALVKRLLFRALVLEGSREKAEPEEGLWKEKRKKNAHPLSHLARRARS